MSSSLSKARLGQDLSSRASTIWTSEAAFVQQLVVSLPDYLEELGFLAIRREVEVEVGRSIADVVAVVSRKQSLPTFPLGRALTAAESAILAHLRRCGAVSETTVAKRWDMESLPRLGLGRLLDCGLLRQHQDGFRLGTRWGGGVQIVAIEAKLARWRDALAQAATYRSYADHVYVALPVAAAAPALREREVFRAVGVGLLLFDGASVTRRIPAGKSTNHDWGREYLLSRVLVA